MPICNVDHSGSIGLTPARLEVTRFVRDYLGSLWHAQVSLGSFGIASVHSGVRMGRLVHFVFSWINSGAGRCSLIY